MRVHVFITGRVQGVGYRYHTQRLANQLGLGGWVRNLPDGRVEAVFEGGKEAVDRIIAWCHQGPPTAVVEQVVATPEAPEGTTGFQIIR